MTEPIKLPPIPEHVQILFRDDLRTYARLAVEQNTAELLRELTTLHRWYADVSMRAEKAEAEVERLRAIVRGKVVIRKVWMDEAGDIQWELVNPEKEPK